MKWPTHAGIEMFLIFHLSMVTGCIFFYLSLLLFNLYKLNFSWWLKRNVYNINQSNRNNVRQFLDSMVVAVSNRHQTVSAYLKVRTFGFADVDKSARCVIQEIEEVFENRAHSCWIFKKTDYWLSSLNSKYRKSSIKRTPLLSAPIWSRFVLSAPV